MRKRTALACALIVGLLAGPVFAAEDTYPTERDIADWQKVLARARPLLDRAAQLTAAEDYAGARAVYDRALRIDVRLTEARLGRAFAEPRLGQLEEALADTGYVLGQTPSDPAAWKLRGWVYSSRRQFAEALADYDAAILLDPRDAESRGAACDLRLRVNRRFPNDLETERAIADCSAAIALAPAEAEYLLARGAGHVFRGRFTEAIADFDAAIALAPESSSPLYGRGIARLRLHDAGGQDDIERATAFDNAVVGRFAEMGLHP